MPFKFLEGLRHAKNQALNQDFLATLTKGQWPDALFVFCSDSRIMAPALLTQNPLGKVFNLSIPGNLVTPFESGELSTGEASAIEYGLEHLNIGEIVICGHEDCGAMKGLLTENLGIKLPLTEKWINRSRILLEHLVLRHPELTKTNDPLIKLECLTKDNVLLQMQHLKTHPAVQKKLAEGTLKIHGWYYKIETREVYIFNEQKNDFISFEETVEKLSSEKLVTIVKEITFNYFNRQNPSSGEELQLLAKTLYDVRYTSVAPIWNYIKDTVRVRLLEEVGKLYVTASGEINPLFDEILQKGPAIHVSGLDTIYYSLQNSPCNSIPRMVNAPGRVHENLLQPVEQECAHFAHL